MYRRQPCSRSVPDPDDEIVIDESSEGDTSSDATDSIDGSQTEDTPEQDAGSETDGVPTIDETDQPGSSENSDDTASGGADAIANREWAKHAVARDPLVVRQTTRTCLLLTLLIFLPFSS